MSDPALRHASGVLGDPVADLERRIADDGRRLRGYLRAFQDVTHGFGVMRQPTTQRFG